MAMIRVLDKNTIDKIAAGEVIERPSSVIKELVENAIDAGSTSITVEIKDGGITFMRISDNGCGIPADQVDEAFLRHSTSKIRCVEDLTDLNSLGFRGEALSSIAAVSQVELITKTEDTDYGIRYRIEGGIHKGTEEIGAPDGTTFLIRNLFFNVPARRKFLKTATTEAGYIDSLLERMALSHPEISFKFISNGQTKLQTSGNTNLKDIIYNVYGRDVANTLLAVKCECGSMSMWGFIGKPEVSRGNRNYENYFINGRYVKNNIVAKAIEDAYKPFMMQHRYPFTTLLIQMDGKLVDINVHPAKMEVRFSDGQAVYQFLYRSLFDLLSGKELIPEVTLDEPKKEQSDAPEVLPADLLKAPIRESRSSYRGSVTHSANKAPAPKAEEPKLPDTSSMTPEELVRNRQLEYFMSRMKQRVMEDLAPEPAKEEVKSARPETEPETAPKAAPAAQPSAKPAAESKAEPAAVPEAQPSAKPEQLDLFEHKFLDKRSRANYRIIGQVFDTYWLVQFEDKLFIIDQHAAHEKVLYERKMAALSSHEHDSQMISPPVVISLSMQEEVLLERYLDNFTELGFEIEPFGGREYALRAVPSNLLSIASKEIFIEMLDSLDGISEHADAQIINERIASMSCKAAVKGNNHLSAAEAEALLDELLNLENPYNCPHGRPTIVSMSRYEMEKKFKRIV